MQRPRRSIVLETDGRHVVPDAAAATASLRNVIARGASPWPILLARGVATGGTLL